MKAARTSARIGQHIAIARRIVFAMQLQVYKAEAQLPHLRIRAAEIAGSFHLVEQFVWNSLARLPVPRKQVNRFAFHAPVLHDLGG